MMKNSKQFDTVKMMRNIRDEISREIQSMNFEEEKRYIRERIKNKPSDKSPVYKLNPAEAG